MRVPFVLFVLLFYQAWQYKEQSKCKGYLFTAMTDRSVDVNTCGVGQQDGDEATEGHEDGHHDHGNGAVHVHQLAKDHVAQDGCDSHDPSLNPERCGPVTQINQSDIVSHLYMIPVSIPEAVDLLHKINQSDIVFHPCMNPVKTPNAVDLVHKSTNQT